MSLFSRREFLRLAGIAVFGSQVDLYLPFQSPGNFEAQYGRALSAAAVYQHPSDAAPIIDRLWPDSVTSIRSTQNGWYSLPQGYIPCNSLQPMLLHPSRSESAAPPLPFWAEVIGPVATVRQWCAADAPLITRIGHGGTAQIIDFLVGNPISWYGIASADGDLLGWTQVVHWQPVQEQAAVEQLTHLEINRQTQQITVFEGRQPILSAPISIGQAIHAGEYHVQKRQIGGRPVSSTDSHEVYHGSSWQLYLEEDTILSGVYWHNLFGRSVSNGISVQITPLLARWLYQRLSEHSFVRIV